MNAPFVLSALTRAVRLRPYQQKTISGIHAAWAAGSKNVLAVLPTGAGKCLARDTPILMYDGSIKPVQDVRVGQLLMGPNSRPRRVWSLARGREMMYRITPVKGEPYVVNESHILSLKRTSEFPGDTRAGEVVNLSVRDYLAAPKYFKHLHKGWRSGVEFREKALPAALPPYLLGVWLGDGTCRSAEVTNVDPEIIEYLRAHAALMGLRFVEKFPTDRTQSFSFSGPRSGRGASRNPVRDALNKLDLLRNKHVPPAYLTGSRGQRLELLAGLLDSDGSLSRGGYDFVSKLENLADSVAYLARSLGLAAYKKECSKTCGNNGVQGKYFRVSISGDCTPIPCLVARKKAPVRLQKKDVLLTAIRVEPIGEGDYYGFEISGDKLFMLGDFTVTHNTVVFSYVMSQHKGASVAIAHRQELIGQIAAALNRCGVRFRIIAPKAVRKLIIKAIQKSQGHCLYDPTAEVGVASVASIKNIHTSQQYAGDRAWAQRITLWVNDEAHHLQSDNIWGTVLGLFPETAIGLGVTATPIRGDGGGLGRDSDGVFDVMIEGPMLADLIDMGYLTPYKVVCAPVSVDYSEVKVGAGGEYVNARLVAAEEASGLTGDIVETYKTHVPGLLALAFVSSVKRAHELAERFTAEGIPAAAISGNTPDDERAELIGKLERRELMVLCNVDVAGEGTDLPAVEVVIMGTKTNSLSRYLQWAGRALRLVVDYTNYDDLTDAGRRQRIAESSKPFAFIIDHANNIVTHGLPDKPHIWTLEGEGKSSSDSDAVPLRPCTNPGLELIDGSTTWDQWRKAGWSNDLLLQHGHVRETGIPCAQPYEAFLRCCEFCGYMPEPRGKRDPADVEGDLELLDEETMAALRASYFEARRSIIEYRSAIANGEEGRMNHMMASANVRRHEEKLAEFELLDEAMGRFGGKYKARGESDSFIQRRFYAAFGVDVMNACGLKRADAEKLRGKIDSYLSGA